MFFSILAAIISVANIWAAVKDYCIIDLSGGASAASYPVAYMDSIPAGGWSDEYKTTKLVLRYIAPGSFSMGGTRPVRFTRAYYIGVFEVTQKQYALVTGKNPSGKNGSTKFIGDTHPVESVSYKTIRGTTLGATWPWTADVDPDTFLGRLRARTRPSPLSRRSRRGARRGIPGACPQDGDGGAAGRDLVRDAG